MKLLYHSKPPHRFDFCYNADMKSDQPLTLPFKIGISPTLKIRGLLAVRQITKGEIIEKCPIILVDKTQEAALRQTVLWKYYYEWSRSHHCIVLGYGSLINHSYNPSARYVYDYKYKLLTFKAIKKILPGEEITVNYNLIPQSKAKLDPELMDFNRHKPS